MPRRTKAQPLVRVQRRELVKLGTAQRLFWWQAVDCVDAGEHAELLPLRVRWPGLPVVGVRWAGLPVVRVRWPGSPAVGVLARRPRGSGNVIAVAQPALPHPECGHIDVIAAAPVS